MKKMYNDNLFNKCNCKQNALKICNNLKITNIRGQRDRYN